MQTSQTNLTEGSIVKKLVLFALPIFLGNVFQQLYNICDSLVVGLYLDDNALAAVTSSGNLIFMFVGFFNGVAMGAGVIIARYFGAKNYKGMEAAIHTDVAFGLVTGVILTILGVSLTPIILQWMGTPEEVLPNSISYFRCYFMGAVFTVMYNIFVGILHAMGDSRHPLYYLIFSSILNVGLDFLFLELGFGVGSAAVATTVSQGVSACLCAIRLLRLEGPGRLVIHKIRFHKQSLLSIIRYGLPSGVQNSVIGMANVVVQSNINSFGAAAMAGCGAFSKLEGFAFLPVTCFAQGLSTFVGQNLGAKQYQRAKKGAVFGSLCSVVMAETIGILFYFAIPKLILLFNCSAEAAAFGVTHCRTVCLFFCLLAFSHCAAGILRGAGRTTVPMITMLLCWCLLRVTYITVALRYIPVFQTISWAYPLTWFSSSVLFLVYLLKSNWLHAFDTPQRIK